VVKLCLSLSFCFQDGVVFKNLVSAQESRFKFDLLNLSLIGYFIVKLGSPFAEFIATLEA